jgi:hypothetical protein
MVFVKEAATYRVMPHVATVNLGGAGESPSILARRTPRSGADQFCTQYLPVALPTSVQSQKFGQSVKSMQVFVQ